MEQTEFKNLQLKDIKPDPNQPRTFFDEQAMTELTNSVREKGVLQPILVRQNGKGYMIVCGERRYTASLRVNAAFKDRNTIPAIIRTLNNEEALEAQIIENLQRKDVHPMEEAVAFKSLLDAGKDVTEIAAKVGKSDFYARQRIKLCSLTKEWQDAFFHNRVTNALALKVALFSDKIQKELFAEKGSGTGTIELGIWTLSRYQGDLSVAPFDLDDATIDKKAGACIGCKFNSATAVLFEDAALKPHCTNVSCFKNKCDLNLEREFELAIDNPEVLFVHDNYGDSTDKWVLKAKKAGATVYNSSTYDECDMPELEPFDEWWESNDEYTEPEARKEYEKDTSRYEADLKEYQSKIESGKFKKAFMLTGNPGKYIYVTLRKGAGVKAGSSKDTQLKQEAGTITAADINDEIKRLEEREKRSSELDDNKVWEQLRSHFRPSPNEAIITGAELNQVEREAAAMALFNKLEYKNKDDFKKFLKLKKNEVDFSTITAAQLNQIVRWFVLGELPPVVLYNGHTDDSKLCLKLGAMYFPSVQEGIIKTQAELSAKRKERVFKRIADLRVQKANLNKTPAAAKEKPSPVKKAAKKK